MIVSEQITLAAIFILWTNFCFLQVYQKKYIGMVYANNNVKSILWGDLQTVLVETIPHLEVTARFPMLRSND